MGSKVHGSFCKVVLSQLVNSYLPSYRALQRNKDLFRSLHFSSDLDVYTPSRESIMIDVKTYRPGHLQLSSDRNAELFTNISEEFTSSVHGHCIEDPEAIDRILGLEAWVHVIDVLLIA